MVHGPREPGGHRADRPAADRQGRALRRRGHRAARVGPPAPARDRRPRRGHMARDLIPPPSPAGRASADPELREVPEAPVPHAEEATTSAPAGPSPFRSRFGFILGGLLGSLVCAGVAFALLIGTSPTGPAGFKLADHWSRWEPATS